MGRASVYTAARAVGVDPVWVLLIGLALVAILLGKCSADGCAARGGELECWGVGQNFTCRCFDKGVIR